MWNYFSRSKEQVYSFHNTTAPVVFSKCRSGSRDDKSLFLSLLSLTNCLRGNKKKPDQWEIKDRIRLSYAEIKGSVDFCLSFQYFSDLVKSAILIQRNKIMPILFAIVLFNPISVRAATYYISPSGSNSSSGTSTSPWKTFAYATPRLLAGDTLILRDGTYTKSTTGLPNIGCGFSGNVLSGTSTQPITIKAEHERQAFLKADGTSAAFRMNYCSYWVIDGLRAENADLAPANGGSSMAGPFAIYYSSNITMRRLLAAKPNTYFNTHGILIASSSNVLVEESEVYNFHRHGVLAYGSRNVTIRRIYANGRNYPIAVGGYGNAGGDEGCGQYDSTNGIIENCISENNESIGIPGTSKNTEVLGSICLNCNTTGIFVENRGNVAYQNNIIENSLTFKCTPTSNNNFWNLGSQGLTWRNNSAINNSSSGFVTENNGGTVTSVTGVNNLAYKNAGNGFYIKEVPSNGYTIDYSNSVTNATNYNPVDSTCPNCFSNAQQTAPTNFYNPSTGQGCVVYIPSNSNLKGAGKNGADIGANIIYRYEYGILTNTKLWDQTTGQFPCGAVITGVNDDATFPNSSCVNVHERLNVGVQGCPIP